MEFQRRKKRMKLFKILCTSLLVLSISIINPSNIIFADENNYPTMPTGQPITQSLSADEYKTYADGTLGYQVQFRLNISYERSQNGNKWYAKNVTINSCSTGVNDQYYGSLNSYSARSTNTTWSVDNSGTRPYLNVTATVEERIGNSFYERRHTHRFAL